MEDSTKPIDPRVIRTRHLIKNALIELLEEMDLNKISVNKIATRATINRVTFYLHYRDIPDMLEKMADEMTEEIREILENQTYETSSEVEWPQLLNLLQHISENARFYKVILTSRRAPIFSDRLLQLLTESITNNIEHRRIIDSITHAGIQKDIAIWYGSSALIGIIISWLKHDMPYTPTFLAKQFSLIRTFHVK